LFADRKAVIQPIFRRLPAFVLITTPHNIFQNVKRQVLPCINRLPARSIIPTRAVFKSAENCRFASQRYNVYSVKPAWIAAADIIGQASKAAILAVVLVY
jgi:hypothetical protein